MALTAKVDTGARTSAIHALAIQLFGDAHRPNIRFGQISDTRQTHINIFCSAIFTRRREVTSSNGEAELHYLNWTSVKIGAVGLPMEVTLTNRDTMPRRMLLEREAISNDMIANQNKTFPQNKLSFTFYDKLKKKSPDFQKSKNSFTNP